MPELVPLAELVALVAPAEVLVSRAEPHATGKRMNWERAPGDHLYEGARSLLTLYVLAGGPSVADVQLAVRSRVVQRATLSLTVLDALEREVGIPVGLAPQRWKKGFLYSDPVAIRKRPGTEVFRASYWARGRGVAPKALSGGAGGVEVLTLR